MLREKKKEEKFFLFAFVNLVDDRLCAYVLYTDKKKKKDIENSY